MSRHGKKRLKERIGGNNKTANLLISEALKNGLDVSIFTGRLRRYLDFERRKSVLTYIRVYKSKIFVFTNKYNDLVTVLNIPNKLMNDLKKQLEKLKEMERMVNNMDKHEFYNKLTDEERKNLDLAFRKFTESLNHFFDISCIKIKLAMDDRAEECINHMAKYIIDSKEN